MANSYYVSPDGNDANPGTLASPFKTIGTGVGLARNAGDTVYVRAGTYSEVVTMNYAGTASANITLKAYNNESVTLDGGWSLPTGNDIRTTNCINSGQNPAPTNFNGLLDVRASYVTVEGFRVYRSRGRGIRVFQPQNTALRTKYVTIKDCIVEKSNNVGILVEGIIGTVDNDPRTHQVTIDGCTVFHSGYYIPNQHGSTPCNWPGAVTLKATTDVTIKNCTIHTNYGEGILSDANNGGTKNVTVQDCVFYDGMAGYISFHAVRNATVERSAFYYTGRASSGLDGTDGVVIAPGERHLNNEGKVARREYWGKDCVVRNCLFVGCLNGVALKRGNSGTSADLDPAMGNVWIYNNTFIRCTTAIYSNQNLRQAGAKTYVKNNVCYNNTTDSYAISAATWAIDADYNHWSSTPALAAFQGANDVTGNPGLVNSSYTPERGKFNPAPLRLAAGSGAINQGVDLSTNPDAGGAFSDDYFAVTRTGTWDMGAHEYDGVSYPTPTATAAASTTTPRVDDTVNFTATPAAGTAPYTFLWDFGDGTTSTTQNPSKTYAASGTYTVTLTVTDANGLKATDTETINVSPLPSTGGGATSPADIEQVVFSAGATSFTVTQTPSWILFFATGASSDNTITADAKLVVGFHDAVNNQSYCFGGFVDDNVSTTQTAEKMHENLAIAFPSSAGTAAYSATVTAVSSSAVSLSWSGTTGGETIAAWCGSGTAFQGVLATVASLTTNGTGTTISGDYNVAIMPATMRDDGNQGIVDFSLGFAKRGGSQMCVGWHSRDNQSTSSTAAVIRTDRVAARPFFGDTVEITAWTTSGITLTPRGRDLNADLPILLLKLDTSSTDVYIGVEDVPTAGSATDYALGFDPAAVLMVLTTLTGTGTTATDSSSGVFGIGMVDDGGTDRTLLVYDKDGASPTVAKSYTNNDFIIKDYAGTTVAEGAASISGNNLRLTLTGTVPSTTYKMLVFAVQEGATAASGPTAAFSHDVTETTDYTDTITVQDLSVGDGTNALSSWDVDWGDGNSDTGLTPGASETHVYSSAGEYTITVTVTDAGTNTGSTTQEVSIGVPLPTASFTISPVTGAAGTTFTLDASGSTAGGNETIDTYEWIVHNIADSSQVGVGGTGAITFYLVGESVSLDLPEAADWTVELSIRQANTEVWDYATGSIVVTRDDITLDFRNAAGSVTAIGPYTATFTANLSYGDIDNTNFAWDFGDTGTSSGAGQSEVSHEYASVVGSTSYTVELVVTLPDGSTLTETKTDYITIIPSPTVPPLLSALKTRVDTLNAELDEIRKHMGALYGVTWTQESSPNTNVYTTTVTNVQWAAAFGTFALKENGTALSTQASLATVQANAGSAWVRYAAGTVTISVHPTGSGSPATNGNYYRWTAS